MEWSVTSEQHLADTFATHINPFWKQRVCRGEFSGKGGIEVHYAWCMPDNPRSAIVISSGRIESLLKYQELIYDFYTNDCAVFILDHRGQGLSGRMTHDPQHGYVAHFDDYVDDLVYFVHHIVKPQTTLPLNLVCHSMGGAIGTLTVLREPGLFAKLVLCSPMLGIRPALPDWLAVTLIKTGLAFNRLRKRTSGYFFGQTPYISYPFSLNKLTHSETRYRLFRKLYDTESRLQLGGVTTEWLHAARIAMDTIEREAGTLKLPVLVFSADDDKIIDNTRQRRVASAIEGAEIVVVDGAYHELFIEKDAIRTPVVHKLLAFIHS